jgi:hypothetical protein
MDTSCFCSLHAAASLSGMESFLVYHILVVNPKKKDYTGKRNILPGKMGSSLEE